MLQEHPVLRDEARAAIEARLLQDHGLRVNADRTYFNVFRGASSSRESYNGWQHHGAPLVSMSLTDLQMRNFPAALGEDPNGLDANSGVYTEGAGRTSFGRHNEVRLLSSELKRSVRANDVGGTYRDKLTAWWNRNEQAVATLYQAQVRKWRSHAGLSVEARAMLKEVLRRADGKAVQPKVTAHVFDINSYPSKDMTWLKGAGPRVVLIMPGGAPALREYANLDALREGIEAMARTAQGRAELTTHFSLYNRKDGSTYQGVEKWLGDIAAGGWRHRIAYLPQRIDGNIFADQAARTRAAELDDIKRLVKSNSEVIEEESTQFVRVLGQLFPEFFIPAKAVELALDVHQAVADGAAQDRRSAARDAVSAGINLAVAVAIGALSAPIRRASPPATGAVERSAFFNPPGRIGGQRIGYLLGPIEAPRPPSVFDDLLDEAERAHNPIDDWDDGTLTLSPSPSRSGTPTTDTASEPNDVSPASTRSSSPSSAPDRGWGAPGQEPVMGEPSAPATPPSSPAVSVPGFGEVGNHQGLPYFNALDWIERLDIPHVYRVQSIEELAGRSPEIEGFEPDMFIGGGGTTVHDRYLFSLETQQAAVDYGNSTFGAGNFAVFRIDTEGVPAMPYRLNINYDMWNASRPVVEARAAGQLVTPDVDWLANYVHVAPPVSGEVPAGYVALEPEDIVGYERGHVFLDNRAVTPSRIHRTI
ncbi:dermonecrotic toxin domain-containing protein [Herbaspirillum sp. YR522]|uniref:dermonecrotic toxin domain-containing protein n=1 Tax=Herbaspirillum sp. YR522 TaxID=1144342 RepID=UPI0005900F4F|nr:DUF6543 domain-containing protein [Herbaspirillum sp. YR522]